MSFAERFRGWWQARDGRERRMLALMFAMLAAFAWWYGLAAPLQRLRDAARNEYLQDMRDGQATAAGLERLATARAGTPATDPEPAVLSAARSAGVAISRQREHDGHFEIGIDSAEPATVLAWIDQLRERHGRVPDTLIIERHNGAVRVRASFRHSR